MNGLIFTKGSRTIHKRWRAKAPSQHPEDSRHSSRILSEPQAADGPSGGLSVRAPLRLHHLPRTGIYYSNSRKDICCESRRDAGWRTGRGVDIIRRADRRSDGGDVLSDLTHGALGRSPLFHLRPGSMHRQQGWRH